MGVEGMPNFNPIMRSTKPIASQYQAVNRAAYARKNSPLQTLKNLFGSLPCVLSFTCHIYPKISEMFQKTFWIWGLKIRNSRLFLPQNFFSDCRVGWIRSFDKFWIILLFLNIFKKFLRSKIALKSFHVP